MRGLQIIDMAPGAEGVAALSAALRHRLEAGGPAVAPLPGPSRHMSAEYIATVRRAVSAESVPDDVVAVISTSGSTGRPRGVGLTEGNLRASARLADLRRPGLAGCDWVLALPATSIGGFNVVARSLIGGTALHVLPSVGGAATFDPADVTSVPVDRPYAVSVVPAQLQSLLEHAPGAQWLARAHTVLIGGAATSADVLARARAIGIEAVATYGMTESTGGCVFDGVPLDDVQVDLDAAGRITLRGPVIAAGYLDGSDDGDFVGPPESRQFLTSDIGEWASGRLRIVGRIDDVVTVHGVNVALGAIEDALHSFEGVRDAAVVARPDPRSGHRLIAYVVFRGSAKPPLSHFADLVRERLGGAARPDVVEVDSLPHLPNGKIDRRALQTLGDQHDSSAQKDD